MLATSLVSASTRTSPRPTCPAGAKGSLGVPRHKMLTDSWQRFGFTNLSAAQITQNPPPVPNG
jgi:hypothetical protein